MAESWFQGPSISGNASADLNRFRFVKNTATATENLTVAQAADGDLVLGVAADTVSAGEVVNVYMSGVGRLAVDNSDAIPVTTPIKVGTDGIGAAAAEGEEYFAVLIDPVAQRDSTQDPPAIVRVVITRGHVPAGGDT